MSVQSALRLTVPSKSFVGNHFVPGIYYLPHVHLLFFMDPNYKPGACVIMSLKQDSSKITRMYFLSSEVIVLCFRSAVLNSLLQHWAKPRRYYSPITVSHSLTPLYHFNTSLLSSLHPDAPQIVTVLYQI